MTCKVLSSVMEDIPVAEMQCGQIGVITKWDAPITPTGKVVQRFKNSLIVLGEYHGSSYSDVHDPAQYPGCYVRLLPPGAIIEVQRCKLEDDHLLHGAIADTPATHR